MAKKNEELSYSELTVKRNELKRKYMDFRFQMVVGHVDNTLIRQNEIAGQDK